MRHLAAYRVAVATIGFGVAIAATIAPACAATLTIAPGTVSRGGNFTASLSVTSDPADFVGAIDLLASFDAAAVALAGVTAGELLDWTPTFNAATGLISVAEGVTASDLSGTQTVAVLTFVVLTTASPGPLTVSLGATADSIGAFGTLQLPDGVLGASVTILPGADGGGGTRVPAPAALLPLALAGLSMRRARRG